MYIHDTYTQTNEAMHKAVAHHPLTDAQPVLRQQLPTLTNALFPICFCMMPYGTEHPFGQLRAAVLVLFPPSSSVAGEAKKLRRP